MSRTVSLPLPGGGELQVPEPLGISRGALRRLDGSEWFKCGTGIPLLLPVFDRGCLAVWSRTSRLWTVFHPVTTEAALEAWRGMMQAHIDALPPPENQASE